MGLTRLECITVRNEPGRPPGPAARSLSVNDSVLGRRQRWGNALTTGTGRLTGTY